MLTPTIPHGQEEFSPRPGYEYAPTNSASALGTREAPRWLAQGLLLEGQSAVLGGPKKTLLTSLAVDLAVSLATATPFLGRFAVPSPRRVLYLTGRSHIQDVLSRAGVICGARGVDSTRCDVGWQAGLPRLCDLRDLTKLANGLRNDAVSVVVLDPLYLLLRDSCVSIESLAEMGCLLEELAEACLGAGTTPVLVHHALKSAGRAPSEAPLTLEDLAFAGVGEVVRQWLLVNRRQEFVPGAGTHDLNLAAGGSAGHSSLWCVAVHEGRVHGNLDDREWRVFVQGAETLMSALSDPPTRGSRRRASGRRH
jgi:hypothetical protein